MRFAETIPDLGRSLPSDVQRFQIPGGYQGTKQTIQIMRQAVDWGKRWPGTRRIVSQLITNCARKDFMCMVQAVFNECQKFHYCYDQSSIECIQGIDETWKTRIGDCDDYAVFICTCLESIGIPCYFKTIKAKKGSNEFTHVYAVANVPGVGQVPLDATMSHPAGWEAPGDLPCKLWPSSSDDMEIHGGGANSSMNGLPIIQNGVSGLPIMTLQSEDDSVSMSGLACGCNKTAQDDNDQTASTMSGLSVISDCDIDTGETMSGLSCQECGGTCGQVSEGGMSGLGDPQGDATIESVIDGSAYAELRAAKDRSNQNEIDAGSLLTSAQQILDPSQQQQAMQMYQQVQASVTQERQSLQSAINAYSQLVNQIQTYSLGYYKPQQLSGLGVAPITVAAIALAAGVSIYIAAQAYSTAMAAWRGQADNSRGLIDQMSNFLESTGHAAQSIGGSALDVSSSLKTVAIVGGIGLLALLAFKFFRKRGEPA